MHRAYKDDSFRRGRGARRTISLPCRDFETHDSIPEPSPVAVFKILGGCRAILPAVVERLYKELRGLFQR